MSRTNDTPLEEVEQRNVVIYCTYAGIPVFAIPNGGSRDRREAARLTAQGVKPGVPDLFIPRAAGRFHGLFIEMKREKGGKISQHQAEWIALLRREGYAAYACPGFDNARMVIEKYLAGRLECGNCTT